MKEKRVDVSNNVINDLTFNMLDKLADIAYLLEKDQHDLGRSATLEKSYDNLKEKIFENFYTSHAIETIIVDNAHPHHNLVMHLYQEYMEDTNFFSLDAMYQNQENSAVHYYFNDISEFNSPERSACMSEINAKLPSDSELRQDTSTLIHSDLNETELYRLENKIESLIAILIDEIEAGSIEKDLIIAYLEDPSLKKDLNRLDEVMKHFKSTQVRYFESLDKINENLKQLNKDSKNKIPDKATLGLKFQASQIKEKLLDLRHATHRDLDLLHEKLHSFYLNIQHDCV